MIKYIVIVTAVNPAYGERPGELEIIARNQAEAIKQARREMVNRGHTRQDGPLRYKAVAAE